MAESREQWPKAFDHLTEWAKLANDTAAPHLRLGQALFRLKKIKEAQAEFEAAKKIDPKQPPPEVLLATLYAQSKDDKDKGKGKALIDAAVKKNANDPVTLMAAARWEFQANDFKKAKAHAEAALAADEDSLDAKLLCGTIARQMKNSAEATKRFETVLTADPGKFAPRTPWPSCWPRTMTPPTTSVH